jgi:hypothetical protein
LVSLSPSLVATSWAELGRFRTLAREQLSEGLMLKKLSSPYQTGRVRGHWWKWKVQPLSVDGVLIYAQKGHGRRATLYTDYTFGVWDGDKLVTFAKAYSGLTDAEIKRMKEEAQANADSDKKEKEKVEKINQADSLIFQTEKQLKEFGEKLSEGNKTAINGALEKLKEAHKSQDLAAIDGAMTALNAAWQLASQEMYAGGAQAGQNPTPGAEGNQSTAGETGGAGGNATDVEYEEVK